MAGCFAVEAGAFKSCRAIGLSQGVYRDVDILLFEESVVIGEYGVDGDVHQLSGLKAAFIMKSSSTGRGSTVSWAIIVRSIILIGVLMVYPGNRGRCLAHSGIITILHTVFHLHHGPQGS